MLTNIKNTTKKVMSMLLAVVMCFTALAVCMPVVAEAINSGTHVYGRYYYYPQGTQFISSIRFGQAEKSADATSKAEQDGHTKLDVDLNSGVSGKDYIFLGYKTSSNINDAMATMLVNAHGNGGNATDTFTIGNKTYSFSITGGGQDLNADAGGDYIYLYATKDPKAGLPVVRINAVSTGDGESGYTMAGYDSVKRHDKGSISDCNAGAGGNYVYLFYDNCSVYTDVTPSMNAFKEVYAKTATVGTQDCYTADSWQTYKAAYDTAKKINDSYSNAYNAGCYTADEIAAAKTALDSAIGGLQGVVKLDAATNGGTVSVTEFSSNVGNGTTITFPANYYTATREGYSFLGWSTDKNATSGSMSNMVLPLGTTVYAIFSVNKYTVKFINTITGKEIKSETVEHGASVTAPTVNNVEKNDENTHYEFKGWSTNSFTNVTESFTVSTKYDKVEHTYYLESETAPTCSKTGSKVYKCSVCGQQKTETLPIIPENHKNTTLYPSKPSTCNVQGYTEYIYCNDCSKVISGRTPLPLADHQWGEWSAPTATCTQNGIKTRKCEICKTTEAEDVAATGHTWGDWKVVREATCTVNGRQQRQCSACKETEVAILYATGHEYKDTVTAPTCTELGYTTHKCECGDSYIDTYVDALGHEWINVGKPIVEATCTTNGKQYQQCSRCYVTQEAVVEALGHDWKNQTIIKEATCTENGLMAATCDRCSESQNSIVIPALGHTWDEGVVTTEPTCTTPGVLFMTCTTCNDERTIKIDAIGHDWGDGFLIAKPTCTTEGSKFYYCSVCQESKDEVLEKLPHDYVGVVTVPTCTEDGYTTYTCSDCGTVTVDDYVESPGHANIVTVVPPSCTQKGYTVTRCLICDNIERDNYVDALGHNYENLFVAPTCTQKGYTLIQCTACNDSKKTDYVDALGHEYEVTTVEPTCVQRGYDYHVCIRGDYTYKDNYVAAAGHKYAEAERVLPTETQSGYVLSRCTVDGCNSEQKEILYYDGKALVYITLYDDNGNPVTEATVTFTELNTGETFVIKTDLNGYFTEVLPEGDYELVISKIGYKDTVGFISVYNGETTIDIPTVSAVECDCYCHKNDFFSKIRRIFAKILSLLGTKHECCEHSEV